MVLSNRDTVTVDQRARLVINMTRRLTTGEQPNMSFAIQRHRHMHKHNNECNNMYDGWLIRYKQQLYCPPFPIFKREEGGGVSKIWLASADRISLECCFYGLRLLLHHQQRRRMRNQRNLWVHRLHNILPLVSLPSILRRNKGGKKW